jgi:hypothetical protein
LAPQVFYISSILSRTQSGGQHFSTTEITQISLKIQVEKGGKIDKLTKKRKVIAGLRRHNAFD